MYCSRPVARSPSAVRIGRPAARCGRNASFLAPAQHSWGHPWGHRWWPNHHASGNDFAPLFRIFDEFAAPFAGLQFRNNFAASQPRFDVSEAGENYELHGEVPGFEAKDIQVEFTDPQTLVIRGSTETQASSGTPPAAAAAETSEPAKAAAEPATDNSDAASTYSTGSYQKPSVEDEEGAAPATPAESTATAPLAETEKAPANTTDAAPAEPQSHYWISERSTGSFQRVFKFPVRVNPDAVSASVKNGILNIVVPKAPAPETKKITVE